MKKIFVLFFNLLIISSLTSVAQVKSGPMVGYSDYKEVLVWVQTEKEASVKIVYWDKTNPSKKLSTDEIKTIKHDGFIAHCIADQVEHGKKYNYEVWVDKKKVNFDFPLEFQSQTLWQYRTDPPNFKFAAGSCAYINEPDVDRPGTPYGSDYEIFKAIYDKKPDFMIWGGDNNYYREVDWNTRTGVIHRNSELKRLPEARALFANTHHYAVYDDHDYGPNDSDRSFWGKNMTLEVFKLFWPNPNFAFKDEGVTGTFFWNDCQFFLMDDRWWRTPNNRLSTGDRDYYGQKQLNWLIDALKSSQAPFKFVITGGQVINPAAVYENMATYPEERKQLLDMITKEKIPGVFFISGDRHHTNLQKLEREGTYPLYDVTLSPLTSGAGAPVKEEVNSPIVEGTRVDKTHNFGLFEVTGKRTDRVLKLSVFDKDGKEMWNKEFKAKDLR
ncbi:MAG: alkaline phosphatase family protein [Spirosomaceae bacterium]|jgi:alkaline phosphatase D|nr:alkaline phosphatase family protein [Spirosomataceae bacterium]